MRRRVSVMAVIFALLGAGPRGILRPAHAQACDSDQRLGIRSRHREAIVRARNIKEQQADRRARGLPFSTAEELGLGNDNGFDVTMRTGADGYMLFVLDTTDPCSSGVFTDQT